VSIGELGASAEKGLAFSIIAQAIEHDSLAVLT